MKSWELYYFKLRLLLQHQSATKRTQLIRQEPLDRAVPAGVIV